MATYVAHNITKADHLNCVSEQAALFEVDRIESDGPWVRPGDHWEVLRQTSGRTGSGTVIHHGIGPRTASKNV